MCCRSASTLRPTHLCRAFALRLRPGPVTPPQAGLGRRRVVLALERDAGTLREALDRLGEAQVLVLLDELEDPAACPAAEAVEHLTAGRHAEARALLLVERAQGREVAPGTLERQVRPHHVHDVIRGPHPVQEAVTEESHASAS